MRLVCALGTVLPVGGPPIVCARGTGTGGTAGFVGSLRLAWADVREAGLGRPLGVVDRGRMGDAGTGVADRTGEAADGVGLAVPSEAADLAFLRVGILGRAAEAGRGKLVGCAAFSFCFSPLLAFFTESDRAASEEEADPAAPPFGRASASGLSPAADGFLSSDGGGGAGSPDFAPVGEASPPALDATLDRRVESDDPLLSSSVGAALAADSIEGASEGRRMGLKLLGSLGGAGRARVGGGGGPGLRGGEASRRPPVLGLGVAILSTGDSASELSPCVKAAPEAAWRSTLSPRCAAIARCSSLAARPASTLLGGVGSGSSSGVLHTSLPADRTENGDSTPAVDSVTDPTDPGEHATPLRSRSIIMSNRSSSSLVSAPSFSSGSRTGFRTSLYTSTLPTAIPCPAPDRTPPALFLLGGALVRLAPRPLTAPSRLSCSLGSASPVLLERVITPARQAIASSEASRSISESVSLTDSSSCPVSA